MTIDPLATMKPGQVGIGHSGPASARAGLVEFQLPDDRSRVAMPWHDALYIAIALQGHAFLAAHAAGVLPDVYAARLGEAMTRVSAELKLGGSG